MPLDAICLSALTKELSARITGMKIDKIQQPERDILLLSLRGNGESLRLLLSAGVGTARIHVTGAAYEQPQTPPMFCMLLRKHLQGARISALAQPEGERMVILSMDTFDELGKKAEKKLALEMMGRHSNFILIGSDGLIIDCLRRVDAEMSEKRQVLPGMKYRLPPKQDKPDFCGAGEQLRRELWSKAEKSKTADKWILDTYSGISPLICREICFRACGDVSPRIDMISSEERENIRLTVEAICDSAAFGEFKPVLMTDKGVPKEFSFMPLKQYAGVLDMEICDSFSALLEAYYTRRDQAERMKRRASDITKTVKTARDRIIRKLSSQREELKKNAERDTLRRYGDLITANMYRVKKGDRVLVAENFFEDSCPVIEIELDPLKSPQQNAAKYYKSYGKAKTAEIILTEQIKRGEAEKAYLDSVLDEIERAESERDLTDIRRELAEAGYIKKATKKIKAGASEPMRFVSSAGFTILVGRNNGQNDNLTLKTARKTDLWLHTQKIHGSHVIISCEGDVPDEETIMEAASLAAYYSQARGGTKIPVDYTQVKYVKKPNGALPGVVIYHDYKTVLVNSDEKLTQVLKA